MNSETENPQPADQAPQPDNPAQSAVQPTQPTQPPAQPAAHQATQNFDPRRRLRELLSVPERDRTDPQWDEINELEIQLAPGNRVSPGHPVGSSEKMPGGGRPFQQKKHPPKSGGGGGGGGSGNPGGGGKRRPRPNNPNNPNKQ
jgi:hypothetical protein